MIEDSFYSLMTGTPAITAIVASRVHHLMRPEGEGAASIVYQRVSTVPVTSLDGDSGLDAVRLQVSCWAATHSASMALAALVRGAVKSGGVVKGITVMQINDEDESTGNKRTILDFNLWQ